MLTTWSLAHQITKTVRSWVEHRRVIYATWVREQVSTSLLFEKTKAEARGDKLPYILLEIFYDVLNQSRAEEGVYSCAKGVRNCPMLLWPCRVSCLTVHVHQRTVRLEKTTVPRSVVDFMCGSLETASFKPWPHIQRWKSDDPELNSSKHSPCFSSALDFGCSVTWKWP